MARISSQTLTVFMPVAIQAAERRRRPVSRYLMPLAFGSLIGGTVTLVGTSPNILISTVRQQVTGHPYGFFAFTPIGLPLAAAAVVFLSFGWRLLPADRRGQPTAEKRFAIEDYTSEVLLPAESPAANRTVADLEALGEGEVTVAAVLREQGRRYLPRAHWTLFPDDILVLQGDPTALQPVIDQAKLQLVGAQQVDELRPRDKEDDLESIEAVVSPDSMLVGRSPRELQLRRHYEINVLAVSSGGRSSALLRDRRLLAGDIIIVQGHTTRLGDALTQLGLLPLAERNLSIGRPRYRYLPLLILLATLLLVTLGVLQVEVAFFVAATAILLLRVIPVREAYAAIDAPILVMLGCLIPVGESLNHTGAAGLLANGLTLLAGHLPGTLAVGLVLVVSMLLTPFLHHAAAVLVMGPVAAAVAKNLGFSPDPFLMAVAFGAASDFLTPIGHQNSALVMRPAGYRFGDYWRLGLPLSVLVAVAGTWLILRAWPLHA